MTLMRAAIFVEPGRIVLDVRPIPDVGLHQGDGLRKVAMTP